MGLVFLVSEISFGIGIGIGSLLRESLLNGIVSYQTFHEQSIASFCVIVSLIENGAKNSENVLQMQYRLPTTQIIDELVR